jgi:nitrite reductase/ring-hydroxylating ferredoxin subunit
MHTFYTQKESMISDDCALHCLGKREKIIVNRPINDFQAFVSRCPHAGRALMADQTHAVGGQLQVAPYNKNRAP